MKRFIDGLCRLLTALIGAMLVVMVLLVFGNVVLRYGFNSAITVSEEVGRWLFVWITFIGAVVALRERSHLGTDVLVSRLPPAGKKFCLGLGHLVMLYICWLIFKGGLEQTRINWDVLAPTTQWPMAVLHAAGVTFAVLGGLMLLLDLWQLLSGGMDDQDLVRVQESEELASLKHGDDAAAPR